MNLIITEFNNGFGNTHFVRKTPEIVKRILTEKINDHMNIHVTDVKVTPVDDLHDKLSLVLQDNNNVEGVLSWRKSATGVGYVINSLSE